MKTFRKLMLFAAIIFPLSTFAERMDLTTIETFPFDIINLPPNNIESRSEVGQTMISAVAMGKKPGIKIEESFDFQVSLLFGVQKLSIKASKIPYSGENEKGKFYGSGAAAVFIPNETGKPMMGCYFPGNAIICDSFDEMGIVPKIELIEVDFFPKIANKKELIYIGGNSKSISILYREFNGDYIKPAFTQEYKYDISEDKIIGFRGARFEVIKADNTEVVYRVLKNMESK